MDSFILIFNILSALKKAMNQDSFDYEALSCESLGINNAGWESIMVILLDADLITGGSVREDAERRTADFPNKPMITLAGLDYLQNNQNMKEAAWKIQMIKDFA